MRILPAVLAPYGLNLSDPSSGPAGDGSKRFWGQSASQMTEHADQTGGISTLVLVTEEPLDWQAFSVWLSLLLHRRGPEVLRVKRVRGNGPQPGATRRPGSSSPQATQARVTGPVSA